MNEHRAKFEIFFFWSGKSQRTTQEKVLKAKDINSDTNVK
jgi:hypothetical protein